MPELRLDEIAGAMNGTPVNVPGDTDNITFAHYHFDTRLINRPDSLFFAFKTESGDGHRFVRGLEGKKGIGAVVNHEFDISGLTMPVIRVDDPLRAAQQLARYVRNRFRGIKYIGITGTAGKTTTKEFIYHVLSRKYRTHRSFKNWNNWIGMPFSILNMKGTDEAAVFELAMSYPGIGEIGLLAEILRPDVAVILNIFPAHLEFLGTVDNTAQGKSEILDYLDADGAGFLNADSEPLMKRLQEGKLPKGRKILFGRDSGNSRIDIRLKEIIRETNKTRMKIDFYGIEAQFVTTLVNHNNIENLFTAIMVAQHLGMKRFEIQEALNGVASLDGRGSITTHGNVTIVDETYNSNPEALKRTLKWVDKEYEGEKIAVLGDMLELGEKEERFHRQVGYYFSTLNYHRLITVGQRAKAIADGTLESGVAAERVTRFENAATAGKFLKEVAGKNAVILFKASRGIQLENAIKEFTQ